MSQHACDHNCSDMASRLFCYASVERRSRDCKLIRVLKGGSGEQRGEFAIQIACAGLPRR